MTDDTSNPLWSGRFTEATDAFVEAFTASEHYDRRLYRQDIRGSKAHARMLNHVGVLRRRHPGPSSRAWMPSPRRSSAASSPGRRPSRMST
ncbi:MAG: hypothetical protein U5L11_10470 [Arhodomonas sp.]|nr:hypothetical protein [Arhodomonas sp.]